MSQLKIWYFGMTLNLASILVFKQYQSRFIFIYLLYSYRIKTYSENIPNSVKGYILVGLLIIFKMFSLLYFNGILQSQVGKFPSRTFLFQPLL